MESYEFFKGGGAVVYKQKNYLPYYWSFDSGVLNYEKDGGWSSGRYDLPSTRWTTIISNRSSDCYDMIEAQIYTYSKTKENNPPEEGVTWTGIMESRPFSDVTPESDSGTYHYKIYKVSVSSESQANYISTPWFFCKYNPV